MLNFIYLNCSSRLVFDLEIDMSYCKKYTVSKTPADGEEIAVKPAEAPFKSNNFTMLWFWNMAMCKRVQPVNWGTLYKILTEGLN